MTSELTVCGGDIGRLCSLTNLPSETLTESVDTEILLRLGHVHLKGNVFKTIVQISLQIALNCQALKFQESCYGGRPWLDLQYPCWRCVLLLLSDISVKSKRTAQKPLHQQYELLYRPERKIGLWTIRVFVRFVNIFHIISGVFYLLRGGEGTTELPFIAVAAHGLKG